MSNQNFPFSGNQVPSQPTSFPYDVVVNEAFPGVVLQGTEPNAVYTAFREVSGCSWWVINADFDATSGEWVQNSPCNANLPAYALEQCQAGTFTRYAAAATVVPGDPITWVPVFEVDANGAVISTPPTTVANDANDQLTVTWSAGSSTKLIAHTTNITDTASASNSVFDQLVVGGVTKWQVDKAGVLQVGNIPFARITGYTPPSSFNNATFTGTTTFNGPITANDPATFDDGVSVTGGLTADTITAGSITTTGGQNLADSPTYTTAPVVIPAIGGTVAVAIKTAHFFPIGTSVIVSDGTSSFAGVVTVSSTTSLTIQNVYLITGSIGNTIASGGTVSYSTAFNLTSSDGTILVSNPGGVNPSINLTQASPYPALISNGYTVPAIGSNVSLTYRSQTGFPIASYCMISANGGSSQFLAQLQSTSSAGGGFLTSVFKNLKVYLGSVGTSVPANSSYIFPGSYDPSITTQGQTFATATNFAPGATTGTLTFPYALAGTSSNTYLVIVSGSLQFQNASRQLTLTGSGTGVSWPNSPQIYQNANAGTFPFTFYGTAQGGSTPSVTWTCNDVLFAEPMTMVMVAYFQS